MMNINMPKEFYDSVILKIDRIYEEITGCKIELNGEVITGLELKKECEEYA